LLAYLIEQALLDDPKPLKERRVGSEVFGRDPGYDTAADPIVRNAASELRKRLRQYYYEVAQPSGVHIELPSGTYLLAFRFDGSDASFAPLGARGNAPANSTSTAPSIPVAQPKAWQPNAVWIAVVVVGLITTGAVIVGLTRHLIPFGEGERADRPAGTPFWRPVLASKKEVFISLGHGLGYENDDPKQPNGLKRITMTDLNAYSNLSGLLEIAGYPFQMRLDTMTNMDDLKDRPVILIGNLNNIWVLRLTAHLRFRYEVDQVTNRVTIRDSMHPDSPGLQTRYARDAPPLQVDYAIAERFRDPTTGSLVVCVAGAGPFGTEAASVFLTQTKYLAMLPKTLANPDTNIQVLLRTSIVDGVPGAPEVIAMYTW
jgi:hypothetical protein